MQRVLRSSEHGSREIRSQTLPELLFNFHQNKTVGRLVLRREGMEKSLYLRRDTVILAASTDGDDRLIQSFLRNGNVLLPQLLRALEISLGTHHWLGKMLVSRDS